MGRTWRGSTGWSQMRTWMLSMYFLFGHYICYPGWFIFQPNRPNSRRNSQDDRSYEDLIYERILNQQSLVWTNWLTHWIHFVWGINLHVRRISVTICKVVTFVGGVRGKSAFRSVACFFFIVHFQETLPTIAFLFMYISILHVHLSVSQLEPFNMPPLAKYWWEISRSAAFSKRGAKREFIDWRRCRLHLKKSKSLPSYLHHHSSRNYGLFI